MQFFSVNIYIFFFYSCTENKVVARYFLAHLYFLHTPLCVAPCDITYLLVTRANYTVTFRSTLGKRMLWRGRGENSSLRNDCNSASKNTCNLCFISITIGYVTCTNISVILCLYWVSQQLIKARWLIARTGVVDSNIGAVLTSVFPMWYAYPQLGRNMRDFYIKFTVFAKLGCFIFYSFNFMH